MSDTENKVENENIEVNYERKPGSIAKFQVHIKPKASQAAYSKALKNVTKEVSLPGFRKGKAPQSLIIQHYNKAIDQEFRDIQIQTAFMEAVQLTKIAPYDRNDMRLKIQKYSSNPENGADIDFEFEAFPSIPDIDLNILEIPRIDFDEVKAADVDEVLNNIRLQFADWQTITDRPVKEDDYVQGQILTNDNKKISEKSRMYLNDPSFPGGLKKQMVGMNPGETKDVTPSDSEEDKWYPQPYRIVVENIELPNLPPIDDELAKKTGVPNVDELRKSIENQLVQRRKQNVLEHQRHHMREFLLERYNFDLPGKVVENVTGRTSAAPSDANENVSHYLTNQARLAFMIHRVSRDHQIELSEEELRFGTMRLWLNHVSQYGEDNSQETLKRIQETAPNTLLSHKVLDFLISKAKVTEPCDGEHHE